MQFRDITNEMARHYEFPNKVVITIDSPQQLHVSASGGHRVLDGAGVSHYIPTGWVHLWWVTKPGCAHFSF